MPPFLFLLFIGLRRTHALSTIQGFCSCFSTFHFLSPFSTRRLGLAAFTMSNPKPPIPNEFQRNAEQIYQETRRKVQDENPLRTSRSSQPHVPSNCTPLFHFSTVISSRLTHSSVDSASNRGGAGQPDPRFIAQSRQNPTSSQHGQPARVENMQMQAMGRESTGTLDTLPEDLRPRPRRETKPRTGCCDGCLSGTSTVLKVSGHVANNAGAFGGE